MPESIETEAEHRCVAALAHNPALLAKFWDRITAGLIIESTAKELLSAIRGQWASQGSMEDLVLARLCPHQNEVLSILFQYPETWISEWSFENELMELEAARTIRDVNAIGALLTVATTLDSVRELKERLDATVSPQVASKHTVNMRESYNTVIEELDLALAGTPKMRGVQTKLPTLNTMTGGLCPGKLWIVAGETSDGKSMLAQNFARAFADANKSGAIYSWEMPDVDITRRTLADVAGVQLGIYSGDVAATNEDFANISKAGRWMKDCGGLVEIVNASSLSFSDLCADIRIKHSRYDER